jgi:hypothetical protein
MKSSELTGDDRGDGWALNDGLMKKERGEGSDKDEIV